MTLEEIKQAARESIKETIETELSRLALENNQDE